MVSRVEFMSSASYLAKKLLLLEIELIRNSTIMFIYRLPVPVYESDWFFKVWMGSQAGVL